MANTFGSRGIQEVAYFLKRIYQGEDPELLRKEVSRFIAKVDPEDIAAAEQNLIDDGYSAQVVQRLAATFMLMGIPAEQSDNPKTWLPTNHILRTVMVEHDLIRCFVADLNDVVESIESVDYLSNVNSDFRKLTHIMEHLNAMKEHIAREDDVIFPCLRRHSRMLSYLGVQGDHVSIRAEIDNLVMLIVSFGKVELDVFKANLTAITHCLSRVVLEHLFQEDEILYPIALGTVNDVKVWERMKAVCDEIGYCGVHL